VVDLVAECMTSHNSTFVSLPHQLTSVYTMPVSTRTRKAKRDGAVPAGPAGTQQPHSDNETDYNENDNGAKGVLGDDSTEKDSDDNDVASAENPNSDTHWQAHNAWRPWEDQLLVRQVDSDRPFEKTPACLQRSLG
jgi:hypothetical protein